MASKIEVTLSHHSPIPLYHQIADQLQSAVENGELAKGEFLPNEIELADQWGVSRPTARRAIQQLVDRGMLIRRRGVGTQVVASRVRRPVSLSSLYDDLAGSGRKPKTKVIEVEVTTAGGDVAEELELPKGSKVLEITRLRSADGVPFAIMRNWLPADVAGDITADDLERDGLYALLRARGVRPTIAHQIIGARVAADDEADLLKLPKGSALVTMRRSMQDDTGRHIELGVHAYDANQYSVETTVVEGA